MEAIPLGIEGLSGRCESRAEVYAPVGKQQEQSGYHTFVCVLCLLSPLHARRLSRLSLNLPW